MCGLVGMAGDLSYRWKDIFNELLTVDVLRGGHSTGVGTVLRHESQMELLKQPGPPHNLFFHPEYKGMILKPSKCLIGHNRFATLGKHTQENAHPFMFDNVLGAHNGTLDHSAVKKLHGNEKFDTDSEAIFCNINEHGIRDTVDKLEGAWALTWYDTLGDTINFLRNDKRPLTYTYSKDRCTLIWASEEAMLRFILERNKIEVQDGKYYHLPENSHFYWEIPDGIVKPFGNPFQKEMKPPAKKAYSYWMGGGGYDTSFPFGEKRGSQTKSGKSSPPAVATDIFTRRLVTNTFRPPYKYPNGHVMNKKNFNRMIADGCAFCSNNVVDWGEFILPISHTQFVCEDCYNSDGVYELISAMVA